MTLFLETTTMMPKISMMTIPTPMKPANCTGNNMSDIHYFPTDLLNEQINNKLIQVGLFLGLTWVRTILMARSFSEKPA